MFAIGRFFRKILWSKGPNPRMYGSERVVGEHTLGNISKEVALLLGYPDFNNYTGHCWRRTTATMAADKGMSPAPSTNETNNWSQKYSTIH